MKIITGPTNGVVWKNHFGDIAISLCETMSGQQPVTILPREQYVEMVAELERQGDRYSEGFCKGVLNEKSRRAGMVAELKRLKWINPYGAKRLAAESKKEARRGKAKK